MSGISSHRAAVFTSPSQVVEVYVEGGWRPGSLLGWRHDGDGACEVWVRVAVGGSDREVWTALAEVRLPEDRPVPGPAPLPAAEAGEELLPGASAAPVLSLSEAAAREQRVAGVVSASAPATPRRRRRHGGDVTADLPAVHVDALVGRHRASGVAGRHRAADRLQGVGSPEVAPDGDVCSAAPAGTGALAPAGADALAPADATAPAAGGGLTDATVVLPRTVDADCLTRPLRLGDRRPRPSLARPGEAVRA